MRIRCPDCEAVLKTNFRQLPKQIECPRCKSRFKPRDLDEGDDEEAPRRNTNEKSRRESEEPTRKRKTERSSKKAKTPWLALGIGAGVAVLITTIIILVLVMNKSSSTTAKDSAHSGKKDEDNSTVPMVVPIIAGPIQNSDDEWFRDLPGKEAPRLMVPILHRTQQTDFDPPRLATYKRLQTKMPAVDPKSEIGKMTLEEIKRATVFIKVGDGLGSSSGSGFVIATDRNGALLATNCHVIDRAIDAIGMGPFGRVVVTAVFDSGLKSEQKLTAEIVGFDAKNDLALLRVKGVKDAPKPIDPRFSPTLRETMQVQIYGFPFGEDLATSSLSPSVTISKGSISSIRFDDQGELAVVQIDGSLNPGNSGGPIVDADGRLVAIAVKTIMGSGIGQGIPAQDLVGMLDGRVLSPTIYPGGKEGDMAVFHAQVPVIDPLQRIKSIDIHVSSNPAVDPESAREPDGTWKILPTAAKFSVPLNQGPGAIVTVRLPAKDQSNAVLQLVSEHRTGEKIASRPVPFKMSLNKAQTESDPMPLSAIGRNPAAYEGKLVLLSGRVNPELVFNNNDYEVEVVDENGSALNNLVFRVSSEIMDDLRERLPVRITIPAYLTCRIGKADANGVTTAYIRRIDLLARGNKVRLTLPLFGAP